MPHKNFSYPYIPPRTSSLPVTPSSSTTNLLAGSTNPSSPPSSDKDSVKQIATAHHSAYVPPADASTHTVYAEIYDLSGKPIAPGEHPILRRSASGRLLPWNISDLRQRGGTSTSSKSNASSKPSSSDKGYNADSEHSSTSHSSNATVIHHKIRKGKSKASHASDSDMSPVSRASSLRSQGQLREAHMVSVKDFHRASIVDVPPRRRVSAASAGEEAVVDPLAKWKEESDGDVWSDLAEEEERMSRGSKESVESKGTRRA